MKRKYLIMVGLILAVLTIGAVSASDDVSLDGNLTASESAPDLIDESDAGDVDVLSDDGEFAPEEFKVDFNDSMDVNNLYDPFISVKWPSEAEGAIDIYVDGDSADSYDIDPDDGSWEWCLDDVSIYEAGSYFIQAKFVPGEGNSLTFFEGTLNVIGESTGFNVEIEDELGITYDNMAVVSVECLSEDVEGFIYVYVGNVQMGSWEVDYDEGDNEWCFNDLGINATGKYLIRVDFVSGGKTQTLAEKTLIVTDEDLGGDDDEDEISAYIEDEVDLSGVDGTTVISIDYPEGTEGTINVYVNNALVVDSQPVDVDEGNEWDLDDLGIDATGQYLIRVDFVSGGKTQTLNSKNVTVTDSGSGEAANDFEVTIWDSLDLTDVGAAVVDVSWSSEVDGYIYVYVDNVLKGTWEVHYEEGIYDWYFEDLGINATGQYIIRVDFAPRSGETRTLGSETLNVTDSDSGEEDDDFYVNIEDEIDFGDDYSAVDVDFNSDVEGTINVYVDDNLALSQTIDPDETYQWYLNDLKINATGSYLVRVDYVPTAGEAKTLLEKTLTVTNNSAEGDFDYDFYDEVGLDDDTLVVYVEKLSDVEGTFSVYVDGEFVSSQIVDSEISYEWSLEDLGIDETGSYLVSVDFTPTGGETRNLFEGYLTVTGSASADLDSEDFNVEVTKNIPVNLRDKVMISVKCPQEAEGNISVEIGDKVFAKEITGEYVYFTLDDLNITESGFYSFDIEYKSVDGENDFNIDYYCDVSVAEKGEEHDSYLYIDVPEVVELGGESIYVENRGYVSGTVTLFVDGEEVHSCGLYGADSFSFNIDELSLGSHNYFITYSGDGGHDAFNMSGSFNVTYWLCIDYTESRFYGHPTGIVVGAYYELKKNYAILNIAGKTYQVPLNDWNRFELDGLEMGDNFYTLTYEGDSKYPARTVNGTITIEAVIDVNEQVIWGSDDETVCLILPDGATGQLVVYKDTYLDEVIRQIDVAGGKNVISFGDFDLGEYPVRVSYENGTYYAYGWQDTIKVIPSITIPQAMYAQGDATVSIKMPDKYEGKMSIEIVELIGDEYDQYEGETIYQNSSAVIAGEGTIIISNPGGKGIYKLKVSYSDDDYTFEDEYYMTINEGSPNFKLNVTIDEVLYGENAVIHVNWPVNHDGKIKVSIDGISVPIEEYEIDYEEYEWKILSDALDMGAHTAVFTYYNDTYYNDDSQIVTFNVNPIVYGIEDELSSDDTIAVKLANGVEGVLIINIDGEEYFNQLINKDYFPEDDYDEYSRWTGYIPLEDLPFGHHDYEFIFTCNGETFTKTGSFNVTYDIYVSAGDSVYGENVTIEVSLPFEEGTVTIVEGGKTYTASVDDEGVAEFNLGILDLGEHTAVITVNGNDKYPSKTVEESFTVSPNFDIPSEIVYSDNLEISLTMPSNTTGQLVVAIEGKEYAANVSNGKATVTLPDGFRLGNLWVDVYYEGNYGRFENSYYVKIIPNITIPVLTTEGEHVITIMMPDYYNGKFTLSMREEMYVANIVDGYGNWTLSDLIAGYCYANVEFMDNSGEFEYYDDFELYVKESDPKYELNIVMPSEILVGDTFWDEVFFPSGAEGNVSVYIDGDLIEVFTVGGYIEENSVDIEVEFDGVSLGEHNITFVYSGDGYYKPTSANFTFTVSNMIFPDVTAGYFTDENPNVYALLISYVEGPFEVLVDGKQIPVEMVGDEYRITLNNITSGIHNYTIRSLANESFTKSGQFNATYIMYWSDDYGIYGQEYEFEIMLPQDATGIVTVNIGGKNYTSDVTGGKATFKIPELNVFGEYDMNVTYSGDEKYYAQTVEYDFDVYYEAVISVNGTIVTASLVLPEDATGKLYIEINDEYFADADLVNGRASYVISDLEVGTYEIRAYYEGADYNVDSDYETVTIAPESKMDPNITVTVEDIDVGGEALIEISMNELVNDQIIVNVGGRNYTVSVDSGVASKSLYGLKPGTYNVTVYYEGNDFFLAGEKTASFTVRQVLVDPSLTITASDIYMGEDAVLGITIDPLATGKVTVNVNDKNYTVTVTDGVGNITVSGLAIGSYTAKAMFEGDDTFLSSEKTVTFTVKKGKIDPGMAVSVSNINVGEDAVISVSINSEITSGVTVNVGGKDYDVELTDGQGTVTLSDLAADTYTVKATFEGNENFTASVKTATFTVSKNASVVSIDVGSSYRVGDSFEICITNNTAVNVTINGGAYEVADGKVVVDTAALAAGEYTVVASIAESDMYLGNSTSAVFTISKYASEVSISVGSSYMVGDSFDILISNNTAVNVTINGGAYEVADGKVVVDTAALTADEYTVVASIAESDMYLGNSTSAVFTISKYASEVSISVGSSYVAGDSFDILIGNSSAVNVTINGVAYDVADGKVVIDTTVLGAKEYTVVAFIDESDMYLGNSTSAVFTISKRVSEVSISVGSSYFAGDSFEIGITNSSAVNVTINGVSYSVADGKVVIDTAALSAKEYTVVASIAESDMHTANSTSTVFTISKRNAPITITVGTQYYIGDSFEIAISNATPVTVMVNDEAKEVSQGKVVINTTALAANTYTVTASCEETDKYLANSTTATFKIIKYDAGLIVSAKNITAGESEVISIAINENATGFVVCSFDNVTSPVNISQGKGNVTLEGLTAGTYTVKVIFMGDSKFDSAEQAVSFIVSDAPVVYPAKIVAKDLSAYYNKVSYSVTVYGTDGNVAAGVEVIFKVNGKKVGSAKTNAKGVATIKLKQVPKTYKITSEALGKTVTKKLTVKQVLKLKKVKVKKSAKKLVLTATLKEGKKAIKGKKITFKFNGKKFKAKTNKKGVAKVTVNKKYLQKLKVGKKVKYQATYLKDTVKKSVKVKK